MAARGNQKAGKCLHIVFPNFFYILCWDFQLEHFERANLPPAVKEALISQTQTVAAKLDADIEALYKAVD